MKFIATLFGCLIVGIVFPFVLIFVLALIDTINHPERYYLDQHPPVVQTISEHDETEN